MKRGVEEGGEKAAGEEGRTGRQLGQKAKEKDGEKQRRKRG